MLHKWKDFERLTPDQCNSWFQFENSYIPVLVTALGLPEELVGSNRACCINLEGLCILVHRLAYPNHEDLDLEDSFGRSLSDLSVIIYLVLEFFLTSGFIFWMLCLRLYEQMLVIKRVLICCGSLYNYCVRRHRNTKWTVAQIND